MITNPIKPLIVKQILIVSTLREDRSRNHIIFTSFIKRQLLLSLNYRILRFQGATFNHFKFSAKVIGYSLLWLHWNELQLFVSLCHHFQSGLRCFNLKLQALNLQASWRRLSVCNQNLTIHIWSDYITRQTILLQCQLESMISLCWTIRLTQASTQQSPISLASNRCCRSYFYYCDYWNMYVNCIFNKITSTCMQTRLFQLDGQEYLSIFYRRNLDKFKLFGSTSYLALHTSGSGLFWYLPGTQ